MVTIEFSNIAKVLAVALQWRIGLSIAKSFESMMIRIVEMCAGQQIYWPVLGYASS
ncbi:protein of unknown function [Moritella yayanosii]|uniref:Uncharacterized protein n=1 Tax=Moritella yayanosii TaxID=69539 RepID=A0A330LSC2_9GAMM|nr:protein of unknown function [Moritella yayanosii]